MFTYVPALRVQHIKVQVLNYIENHRPHRHHPVNRLNVPI
jgi:hypothetical protein